MEECDRRHLAGGRSLWIPVLLAASLLVAIGFRIVRHGEETVERHRTVLAMGTLSSLIIESDAQRSDSITEAVVGLITRLDHDLDAGGAGSLGRLNLSGSCRPSPDLSRLLEISRTLTVVSRGTFDPSIRPLVTLWGFETDPALPDSASIDSTLLLCGWDRISSEGERIVAETGSGLDLGAIAAGYAADRAFELAMGMGAEAALIDMGGEIRCGGRSGRVWRIAIRNPRGDGFYSVLEMQEGAVSTSGDYESFFIENGVRYSHILDPASGYPAGGSSSVTVTASSAVVADALSTAFAVGGPGLVVSDSLYSGVLFLSEGLDGSLEELELGSLD